MSLLNILLRRHRIAKTICRHTVETISQPSAVFDLHFSPHRGQGGIYAAVSSTGTISFFKLAISEGKTTHPPSEAPSAKLQTLSILSIPDLDKDVLFTYFAWHPTIPGLIAITTASGLVILAHIHADYQGLEVLENPIIEHSLEAWVVAFSPPQPQPSAPPPAAGEPAPSDTSTIFSGGDDSALKYTTYDPSPPSSDDSGHIPYPPASLPGRHHSAGVTAILPLPHIDLVLTGSYDDTLRIFRIAPLHTTYGAAKAKLLAEIDLGGGVWRLNMVGEPGTLSYSSGNMWVVHVLASCMHAGSRVLRLTGGYGEDEDGAVEIAVVARFEEHESMNYGSDWSRVESRLAGEGEGRRVVCVSTSFYDKLLCVWEAGLP